ncbi:hypothetical protein [Clostridium ljungdahlii]|uniref:Putative membrane protein n=1 Tax=Clostridium ljungdahlii (strain ATCC 55383 / DSM 13528 / PETC) TaxID=748727 RepID=D8GS47_CLOLD|nr:hypothetical protein [Clostridium ljungdahlii]ADK14400.1 putative membrane protein [Clostridium ljungdahlii DSM 13528]OAA88179.1 hypothetical protein WX45_03046 [Clostridium ljungdahlii DSM 13528]
MKYNVFEYNYYQLGNDTYNNSKGYYYIMMTLGMFLSILWVIFVNAKPFSDFDYYYNLAKEISRGLPWGDTYTSVGYSIVLGGIFKLFGASVLTAKIFNLCITFINYLCFKFILSKVNLKEIDRKIIFGLFVLFPNNILFNSILGTELIFTSIMLAVTCLYFSDLKLKYFFIGILTGLNTIVKPFFIVFFFAIFLVDVIKHKKLIWALRNSLIVLIMSVIVISPWIYRNTKLMGQRTFVSNNGGIVLYINNNSQNHLGRWMPAADVEDSIVNKPEYKKANRTEQNKMLSAAAKKWIKSHPVDFIKLGFKRLLNTYFWSDDVTYSTYGSGVNRSYVHTLFAIDNIIRVIVFLSTIIYVLLYSLRTLYSIFKGRSDELDKFKLYLIMLFFMFTSVYFVTEGQGRYSFPEIFIAVYCCYFSLKYLLHLLLKVKVIRA